MATGATGASGAIFCANKWAETERTEVHPYSKATSKSRVTVAAYPVDGPVALTTSH